MISQELLPSELVSLVECSVELHLTGSRFFGHNQATSDYDFFCLDSLENRTELRRVLQWTNLTEDWLERNEVTNTGVYDDMNITETWRHFGSRVRIDVQFVKDVQLKIEVQNYLKGYPFQNTNKNTHGMVWDWVYRRITKEKEEKEKMRVTDSINSLLRLT